jgi:hypothetical protein
MIANILEKLLFKNQPVSEEERQTLLDWFGRAESAAAKANPVTGQITPGGEQSDVTAMVQEALKSRQWINNLSEISDKTGLQIAGEFRTGNGKVPGDGFTGGRFGYPGFTYNGTDYFLAGVSNDVLQVGLALASGKIIAGGGDVIIDEFGVSFLNQEGNLTFEDTNGSFDTLGIYSDAGNDIVVANAFGGAGVRFDIDDASHNVGGPVFTYDGVYLYTGSYDGPTGLKYKINGVSLGYPLTATSANNTPADATTYYFGSHPGTALATTAQRRKINIPCPGTVTRIALFITCVAGSNEQSTMSFRLNDTTDTAITTTLDLSGNPVEVNNNSLGIAVAAGDYFEIKWVTPTWATNPTAVSVTAQVWIEF